MMSIGGHPKHSATPIANALATKRRSMLFQFSRNRQMKKAIQAAVLASLLTSFSAFAHHPAQAIVDAETWLMIDQNLQDVDSPHLDLDFTSM
jgi:hypothetical protein